MHRIPSALALTAIAITATFVVRAEEDPVAKKPTGEAAVIGPAVVKNSLTIMPEAFTSFGACEQGGYLYMIGGHTGAAHEYDRDGFNRNFYRLNLRDRSSWEILPGGVGLQSVALVSDGTKLYRVGGMTALNAKGEPQKLESSLDVKSFDPLTRQWSDLPSLPEARSSHDAIIHNGLLYVFGGWKLAGDALEKDADEGAWHTTALVLNPNAPKPEWREFEQPFKTRAIALASCGRNIYVIGGMDENGITNTVHLLDAVDGKWSKGPDLPGFAFGSSAYAAEGRVFATNWEGTLLSHSSGEETWHDDGTLTFPRFFHRLVATHGPTPESEAGELAAIGGVGRGGQIRNIEWLKPRVKGPRVTRVVIPAPGKAKCRQGIFFHNNELYVFGGNDSVEDHQFKPENFLDEAFKINLHQLRAERISAPPVKRQSYQTFMLGTEDRFAEKLGYAVGGFGHDGTKARSHAEIYLYSIDANVWEPADIALPSPLTQFGLTQYGGRVYLFGGMDFDPARGSKGEFKESDTIWMWDANAKEDAAKKSFVALKHKLPTPRRAFGGAELDGKYYIVGGMTSDFEEMDRCDVYDFKSGEWSTIPDAGDARLSPKLIPLNGKLYLVGGSSPTLEGFKRNSSVEVFDPATGKWSMLIEDLGENLGELQAFAYGHRILLYSVHNNDGEIRLLFIEP